LRRRPQRNNFSVGRWIVAINWCISPNRQDFTIPNNDCTNRDLACQRRHFRLLNGKAHEAFIGHINRGTAVGRPPGGAH
jgi:hypothetical protein